ncbi:substrate-binding periplasmic protein [Leucobacter sp. GX24907]
MTKISRAVGHATLLCTAILLGATGCASGSQPEEAANACVPQHDFDTIEPGVLTVTMYDFPPITLYNDGDPEGVDVDIIQTIADRECLPIEWVHNSPAANIPSVQSGRADIALGAIYRTAERADVVALSDPIYTDSMALISREGYSDVSALSGKTTGMVGGYLWVEDMNDLLGDSVRVYQSNVEMYADLESGRLDAAVDGLVAAQYLYEDNEDYRVEIVDPIDAVAATKEPAQIALISTFNNDGLADALNANLADIRANGELSQILSANNIDEAILDVGEPRLIE